jgi:hypothetical protein
MEGENGTMMLLLTCSAPCATPHATFASHARFFSKADAGRNQRRRHRYGTLIQFLLPAGACLFTMRISNASGMAAYRMPTIYLG